MGEKKTSIILIRAEVFYSWDVTIIRQIILSQKIIYFLWII